MTTPLQTGALKPPKLIAWVRRCLIPQVAVVIALVSILFYHAVGLFAAPISEDGAWYSYPALSLSRGEDPREHLGEVDRLLDKPGVRAAFNFDTKDSLRQFPLSAWLGALGASIWTLKAYALLEYLLLLGCAWLLFRRFIPDRQLAMLSWALLASDMAILNAGQDLRPDLLLTSATIAAFLLIVAMQHSRGPAMLGWGLAAMLAGATVALLHVTAPIPLAMLIAFMAVRSIGYGHKPLHTLHLGIALTATAVFLARSGIMDMLIPSASVVTLNESIYQIIWRSLSAGVLAILQKEASRWRDYFLFANVPQLLMVLGASGLLVYGLVTRGIRSPNSIAVALTIGCVTAMATLAILDSRAAEAHVLPLVPLLLLLFPLLLQSMVPVARSLYLVLLTFLVIASAGLKITYAVRTLHYALNEQYSNVTISDTLNGLLDPGRAHVIAGPTEMWPYIDGRHDVLLIDTTRSLSGRWETKSTSIGSLAALLNRIDLVVLNKDYLSHGWDRRFSESFPQARLTPLARIGTTDRGRGVLTVYQSEFREHAMTTERHP